MAKVEASDGTSSGPRSQPSSKTGPSRGSHKRHEAAGGVIDNSVNSGTEPKPAVVDRMSAMCNLAASVNEPITATVTNALAALQWLNGDRPNLNEARDALNRIIEQGQRAGNTIHQILALEKNLPTRTR